MKHAINRQRGTILLVTLVLLLVMTIGGVALMKSGKSQALMTRSFQFSDRVFHKSNGEIAAQIVNMEKDDSGIIAAISSGKPVIRPVFSSTNDAVTQTVTLEHKGDSRAPMGNSIEGGTATGILLTIQSNTVIDSQEIKSNQTQAMTYVKPK